MGFLSFCLFGGQCLFQMGIIACAGGLWYFTYQAHSLSVLDVTTIEQMMDEWQQQPFVEITPRYDMCKQDEETLYSVTWGGTERGCKITNFYGDYKVETYNEFAST